MKTKQEFKTRVLNVPVRKVRGGIKPSLTGLNFPDARILSYEYNEDKTRCNIDITFYVEVEQ